jgi:hypothetical protein
MDRSQSSQSSSSGDTYESIPSTSCANPVLNSPGTHKRNSLPSLSDLTGQVVHQSKYADGIGGFADVFKALWKTENVRLCLKPPVRCERLSLDL